MPKDEKFDSPTLDSLVSLNNLYLAYIASGTGGDKCVRAYKYVTKDDYMSPWPYADNWILQGGGILPLCYAPGTFNEELDADKAARSCAKGIHLTSLDTAVEVVKGYHYESPNGDDGLLLRLTIVAVEFKLSDIAFISSYLDKFRVYRCTSVAEIDPYSFEVVKSV